MANGIDISGWQSGFNVSAVDADFVFIKATGGGSFTSSEFGAQTASAEASGKHHGFYHYASEKGCAADPITEANHFLNTVSGHVGPTTGIALDWEETNLGNTAWAYQWLEHVSAALGRNPSTIFLYMSQATVNAYDWSAVINAGYRLWCAQYPTMAVQGYGPVTGPPVVRWGAQGITMWQYSSSGRINGWGGNLDLNVLYTDWDAIHGGASAQSGTITPITGVFMALTDAEQAELLTLARNLAGYLYAGGPSVAAGEGDPGSVFGIAKDVQAALTRDLPQLVAMESDVQAALTKALPQLLAIPGALVSIAQGIGSIKAPAAAVIDVKALAAEIVPLLTTNQAHQFIVALGQALPKE